MIRREILRAAEGNQRVQDDLKAMCRDSVLFWLNLFVWTYRQREVAPDGTMRGAHVAHVPFITWPSQDVAFNDLRETLAVGKSCVVSKSREEGATWICIADNHHLWQFRPDSQIIEVSRIEDLVDKTGDPLALFWKHDYITTNQPDWLLPTSAKELVKRGGNHRKYMVILNPENGSTITGMASTEHIARGGRYLRGFFDEMAMMPNAGAAWRSAADACVQRVANSTPFGPGTEYARLRREGMSTGSPHIISLMYFNNPEKSPDRKWTVDTDGSVTGEAGRGFWGCRWLTARITESHGDAIDVGQNIFADDIQSGDSVFRPAMVTQHRENYARDPVRCTLSEDGKGFWENPDGNWYVWAELVPRPGDPGQRIIRRTTFNDFVAFLDPSYGKGASNTACAFMNRDTFEFVAEFIDPFCSPNEVADELVPALRGIFRGQRGPCFIGWEENGPGESLWLEFVQRHKFRRVYQRRRLGSRQDGRTRNYGWRSGRREKRVLLQHLGGAMTRDAIRIYSAACLNEMLEYVYFPDGSCGPGHTRDETSGARESHGDRVIAVAGCLFMQREVAKVYDKTPTKYAKGTWGELTGFNEIIEGWSGE